MPQVPSVAGRSWAPTPRCPPWCHPPWDSGSGGGLVLILHPSPLWGICFSCCSSSCFLIKAHCFYLSGIPQADSTAWNNPWFVLLFVKALPFCSTCARRLTGSFAVSSTSNTLVLAMGSVHSARPSGCILGDFQGAGPHAGGLQDNLWVWCKLESETLACAGVPG